MTEVVVIGGGLSGLVAASRLAESGLEVSVLEQHPTVGGRVRTTHEDGYTFDRGFQVLFDNYPAVQRELDLEALDLRRFAPGATLARPGERSVLADPLRDPRSLTGTLFNREIRIAEKVRLLQLRRELARRDGESILDPSRPDQTIESYLADRGFSQAFAERFAAPFYGGITLDRTLSTDARVFEYTFKMLGAGSATVPAMGMQAIPDQLADRARAAGAEITTEATVESIGDEGTVNIEGETLDSNGVVVATGPRTASELTGVETPDGTRGCTTVYASFPSQTPLDTGTRLLLNVANERPNQVAQLSAVAPEYAPDGEQFLAATFLGREASDEHLFEETRNSLRSWYPERSLAGLEHLRTERVAFAQFDQPPGFRSTLPDPDEPDGPVVLAGDHTRWCSIQGALESGQIASNILRKQIETV